MSGVTSGSRGFAARVTRRRMLVRGGAATAGLSALFLAACGGSSNNSNNATGSNNRAAPRSTAASVSSPASTAPRAATAPSNGSPVMTIASAAAETPQSGGTLRIAAAGDLTPKTAPVQLAPPNYVLYAAVYDTLIRYKSDALEAQPELADSWEFNGDRSQLTFHLQKGLKYHNGQPFTAQSVMLNIQHVADPAATSQLLAFARWITKMEAPDDTTLTLTFDQPRPSILDLFDQLFIAEPTSIPQTLDGKAFVGTGPFQFKEWQPGDHYTFTKSPTYYKRGRPYLDGVEVHIVPDQSAQLINLQSGASDLILQPLPNDARSLMNDKKYQVLTNPQWTGVWYVGIDVKSTGMSDKRARQAVGFAMDRQRMYDTVFFGFGQLTTLPWPKDSPAYDASFATAYTYDLVRARQLLAAAGVSSVSLPFTLANDYPDTFGIADILQADLASIGIKTTIAKIDHAQYAAMLAGGKLNGIWSGTVGFVNLTPSTLFVQSFPYRVPNASNYESQQYRDLIQTTLSQPDSALKDTYRQINQLLVDEAFLLPLTPSQSPFMASATVRGFALTRGARMIVEQVWLHT